MSKIRSQLCECLAWFNYELICKGTSNVGKELQSCYHLNDKRKSMILLHCEQKSAAHTKTFHFSCHYVGSHAIAHNQVSLVQDTELWIILTVVVQFRKNSVRQT